MFSLASMRTSKTDELLTPADILTLYPEMRGYFTPNDLGTLRTLGFIRGKKLTRGSLISKNDTLEIFRIRKANKIQSRYSR